MNAGILKKIKVFFILVSIPLWIACILLLVEAAWRVYGHERYKIAHSRVVSACDQYREADDIIFQKVRAQYPPPDSVPWQLTPRNMFLKLDEAGRHDLAKERREMIIVCDGSGKVASIYPCTEKQELKALGARVKPGGSLDVLFPPQELEDVLVAIRQAGEDEKPVRDYHVPLGNDQKYLAEFNVLRVSDEPLFALFLGDSRYEMLGYSYRPNIYRHNWYTSQFLNSEFWTNDRGLRDRKISLPKPDGVVRIVCVGGSTTVEGPHNELTYPKLTEKLLRERFKTDAIEVINCGVDAMGFPSELERMPDWLALEPDLIIHYNIVNNMPGILGCAINDSGMRDGWKGKMRAYASHSKLIATLFPNYFLPKEKFVTAQIESLANRCFREMNSMAKAAGAALAVASFTVPDVDVISTNERLYFDESFHTFPIIRATTADYNWAMGIYNKTAQKFCRENEVLYIPVAENFSGGADTFTDICHTRLRGIELKAQIMADCLEEFVRERLHAE